MSRNTSNKTLIAINRALLRATFRSLGALPWRVLYALASSLAWLAHSVVKYRRAICADNIRTSFPEMTEAEVKRTSRRFYSLLADYFVETVKLGSMGRDEMMRRMKFENVEEVNADLRKGRNVSVFLGHIFNWEWVSTMPLWLDLTTGARPCQIYHPLDNIAADQVFAALRTRFGATNLSMAEAPKALLEMQRDGTTTITGYIADQTPPWNALHHWLTFLHHDTAVFMGAEKISRKLHAAAYYIDMRSPARGEYVARFVKMTPDSAKEKPGDLTQNYFDMLAASIRRDPARWLWTHRRWKHHRNHDAGDAPR
ncbi:MAG: lysophospholipid acyltransferase family protein [Muribaculaceae bacterium]|nr:lysophospholipid acyltransferase family protein [Muribaculaceae bacterium]